MKSIVLFSLLLGACLFLDTRDCDAADQGIIWKSSLTPDQVRKDISKKNLIERVTFLAYSEMMERLINDPVLRSSDTKLRVWPAIVDGKMAIVAAVSSPNASSDKSLDRLVKDVQTKPQIANARGFNVDEVRNVPEVTNLPPRVGLADLEAVTSAGGDGSAATSAAGPVSGATGGAVSGAVTAAGGVTTAAPAPAPTAAAGR